MSEPRRSRPGPTALVRAIVVLVLTMLLVAGIATIEFWPFTGWRLYSNTKGPTSGSYFAYRVDRTGEEHVVDYHDLPYAYARAPYILDKFPRLDGEKRDALCSALAQGEREEGRPVAAIRVYWERRRVVPVDGERRTKLFERELYATCAQDDR